MEKLRAFNWFYERFERKKENEKYGKEKEKERERGRERGVKSKIRKTASNTPTWLMIEFNLSIFLCLIFSFINYTCSFKKTYFPSPSSTACAHGIQDGREREWKRLYWMLILNNSFPIKDNNNQLHFFLFRSSFHRRYQRMCIWCMVLCFYLYCEGLWMCVWISDVNFSLHMCFVSGWFVLFFYSFIISLLAFLISFSIFHFV